MVDARHENALNFSSSVDTNDIYSLYNGHASRISLTFPETFFQFLMLRKITAHTILRVSTKPHFRKKAHFCKNWSIHERTSSKCYLVIHYCLIEVFIWLVQNYLSRNDFFIRNYKAFKTCGERITGPKKSQIYRRKSFVDVQVLSL